MLIFWLFMIAFALFPLVRCIMFNLHYAGFYSVYDVVDYFVNQKWKVFREYGITVFCGMFGKGKTLSMTHKARTLYKRYGDTILFISNYKLYDIPYVPLVNFNQLVELGHGDTEKYQGFVVLIDEIEDVLSHRNYANFPLQLLNVLTQQRKKKIVIYASCQRFFMVDKLFRAITTFVVDCNKYWRFQSMRYYDAWDYENAMNPQLVRSLGKKWWFVRNVDFDSYSTEQMIDENMSANFISNEEKLTRIGLDNVVNEQAISRPSLSLKRSRKQSKK